MKKRSSSRIFFFPPFPSFFLDSVCVVPKLVISTRLASNAQRSALAGVKDVCHPTQPFFPANYSSLSWLVVFSCFLKHTGRASPPPICLFNVSTQWSS